MRFRMLGPLRVHCGSGWVPVPAAQQRVLLAALLVDAGTTVSIQRLAFEIWGDRPPRSALKMVHAYVMRLRRMLGGESASLLVTREHGYELLIADGDLDTWEFERLAGVGQAELAGGRPELATAQLSQALALWRGPVLADVPDGPSRAAWAGQLEQTRLATLETYLTALLDLERYAEAATQLHRLVEKHPLRERLWALLMRAQRADGRRADALATYQRARRVLQEELGLAPGEDLRQLQRDILTEDRSTTRVTPTPPPRPVAPAQLPADVNGFTGREDQLELLDSVLPRTGDATVTAVVICAITGTAGVGKTALAIHWAHHARDRFPDGQLYANLCGYDAAAPLRPMEVLARFLAALGVPHEQIPLDAEEATALYRSLVAGRRVLVVLDNARAAQQVRPLLPGGPECVAIVTSRDRLAGLVAREGAVRLDLDVLPAEQARSLLARMLGPERIAREAEPAGELAQLCGYLPLALRIAAALLLTYPHLRIDEYAQRLRQDGLAALELDGDSPEGVNTAFSHSYRSLPEPTQRLFCLLGLVPGTSFEPAAAAALAGMSVPAVTSMLNRLAGAHLVELHAGARCDLHDLLRRYAANRSAIELSDADRSAALRRLHDYYLRSIRAAAARLYPEMLCLPAPETAGPTAAFDSHSAALAWLDAERYNLVAAVTRASPTMAASAWLIADALRGYLMNYRHVREWGDIGRAGLAAAETAGDLHGMAAARFSLGGLHWVTAHYQQAIEHYSAAVELSRRAGWAVGEGATLGNLGLVYWTAGQLDEAAAHLTAALAVDERTGRLTSRATNLTNLGLVHGAQGRPALAAEHLTEALGCFRRAGSLGGEASVLANLGETYHLLGRLSDALDALHRARVLHRRLGDRRAEAETTRFLAAVERDRGRLTEALDQARAAAAAGRDAGDGRCEAEALVVEASIQDRCGEHSRAAMTYRIALDLARRDGYRYTEAEALIGTATAWIHAGDPDRAAQTATASLEIVRSAGYPLLEGAALTALSAADLGRSRLGDALDWAQQALAVETHNGRRLAIAHARLAVAMALDAAGRSIEAKAHRDAAVTAFAETGAALPMTQSPSANFRTGPNSLDNGRQA
jgi:DNA-binding SARP family transcriptional activator